MTACAGMWTRGLVFGIWCGIWERYRVHLDKGCRAKYVRSSCWSEEPDDRAWRDVGMSDASFAYEEIVCLKDCQD